MSHAVEGIADPAPDQRVRSPGDTIKFVVVGEGFDADTVHDPTVVVGWMDGSEFAVVKPRYAVPAGNSAAVLSAAWTAGTGAPSTQTAT